MEISESKSLALQQQRNEPLTITKREIISQLSACLALVRPVSMSDDAATEWLTVAAAEISGVSRSRLNAACRTARRECTYHGQILPTILRELEASSYRSADRFLREWHGSTEEPGKLGSQRVDALIRKPEDFL